MLEKITLIVCLVNTFLLYRVRPVAGVAKPVSPLAPILKRGAYPSGPRKPKVRDDDAAFQSEQEGGQ